MNAQFGSEQAPLTAEQDRNTTRYIIAEMFGWTLDYIDSLSLQAWAEILGLRDARNKIAKSKQPQR